MWDASSPTRGWACTLCTGRQSLNYCTTGEVPPPLLSNEILLVYLPAFLPSTWLVLGALSGLRVLITVRAKSQHVLSSVPSLEWPALRLVTVFLVTPRNPFFGVPNLYSAAHRLGRCRSEMLAGVNLWESSLLYISNVDNHTDLFVSPWGTSTFLGWLIAFQ